MAVEPPADSTTSPAYLNQRWVCGTRLEICNLLVLVAALVINILGWMGKIPAKPLAIANLALLSSSVLLLVGTLQAYSHPQFKGPRASIAVALLCGVLFATISVLGITGHITGGELSKIFTVFLAAELIRRVGAHFGGLY